MDTINGTWSYLSPISEALLGVNSIYINETSRILIAGGTDTFVIPRNSCYWYNPSANSYSSAASLPLGRWSGKLVRVKNNLYLIGSVGNSFSSPDGLIFRYSLISNLWEISDTMPAPRLHEAAVCVIKDSLIVTIGGSAGGFSFPKNIVRIYNPMTRLWKTLTPYPISVTTAHAESHKLTDSTFVIVAFGGYSGGYVSLVYRGNLTIHRNDSISLSWTNLDNFPLSQGVYRVSGGKWNNYLLFGPFMRGSSV
ncbi:MAG: hypothetical protein N2510_08995, partial [Ignavibacteria bacterium]|nr:hypothetical protein [Ignavibacteria bacterium]